jgi:hypothetical protein
MTNRRVFVIQAPARKSPATGRWVEKFDLSPAEEHGRLVRVLGYGNVSQDLEPTRERFREVMLDFDPSLDSIMLLGDPVACAQAVSFLTLELGVVSFTVLKWDRRVERYLPYEIG